MGADPGDFLNQERAKDYMLKFVGQMTIPNYRFVTKLRRDYLNAERGYREYGRESRPLVEVSYLDELADLFGFPPSKTREAMELMKTYKDEKFRNMLYKHHYLYKAVDAMEDKDYSGAMKIIKEAESDHNIKLTTTEIQQAINKKKEDIWLSTKTGAPKPIREKPEFQRTMEEARGKFLPSRARSYGTKPMWSSLSQAIEESSGAEAPINIEE
jgi:hypothetical protein